MKQRQRILAAAAVLLVIIPLAIGLSGRGGDQESYTDGLEPADQVGFLTGDDLPAFLTNGRFALVEFGGITCIPCQKMQPLLAELKKRHGENIDIINVYLDREPRVARWFDIMAIPTQVIFDGEGKALSRHLGIWPIQEMENELRRLGIIT